MDAELMHNCLPDRALASTSCMFLRTCSDRQKEVFPATWKATWTGTAMSVDLTMIFHCFCYLLPLPQTILRRYI